MVTFFIGLLSATTGAVIGTICSLPLILFALVFTPWGFWNMVAVTFTVCFGYILIRWSVKA